jgi:hypothetical protein
MQALRLHFVFEIGIVVAVVFKMSQVIDNNTQDSNLAFR